MLSILVVDDEPALRSFAAVLLEDLGYCAIPAADGRAAVQHLLQDPSAISAVLLDMSMPGMTPEETFRQMREISPTLPVFIVSGELEATVRDRFPAGTIAGYISKPYSDEDLEQILAKTLAQPAPSPASAFSLVPLSGEDVSTLGREYLEACRQEMPEMADLLAMQDFASLRLIGHKLKGGGCFGFSQLPHLGAALEESAQASDFDACSRQLQNLEEFLEQTVVASQPSAPRKR